MSLAAREKKLRRILGGMGKVLVAYSGGADSSLLLHVAAEELGRKNVLALIATSQTYPVREKKDAVAFCRERGIRYLVKTSDEMADTKFTANTDQRCYYCKSHLYRMIWETAREKGYSRVIEGSNADDLADYRPGRTALAEQGVESPLLEAGFSKKDVRDLSRRLGLPTHDKPAKACLASRIPYGCGISSAILKKIDAAERFLETLGITQVRVRYHETVARIELLPGEMHLLLKNRTAVTARLKKLGFSYVTMDLAGYRTGSMNETLGTNRK